MKNSDKPINPQSENWQDDMEKHIAMPQKHGSPSLEGIGLTKREYFAGLAMQSIIAGTKLSLSKDEANIVASHSIQFADELLKQLENE
jgi:hypothetical protein